LAIAEEDVASDNAPSVVIEKLKSIGLKQVAWVGKCEADRVSQGRYDVPLGEAGNYALVFDNTFSKSISKQATVFLLTYPTAWATQIHFGAQAHHGQAMAGAMAIANGTNANRSPRLRPFAKNSTDSLRRTSQPTIRTAPSESALSMEEPATIHTGVLQKRRRKKHQGFARRFFCLDYTSSTLSYYHDRNSSALRGAIPLSLAAIGANHKTREISIDSGAEIWHLKATNEADFQAWKAALEKASRNLLEASTPGEGLKLHMDYEGPNSSAMEAQEWARLETLLGKVSGTRDAVRRLCQEVATPATSSGPQSTTPTEVPSADYFALGDDKRPFWKRKTSTNERANIFKRSVSAQLAVPLPGADNLLRAQSPGASSRHRLNEDGMYDHCKDLLRDLDSLVTEFAAVMNESKVRRSGPPKSAVSRLSMQSVESQEYFDAESGPSTQLLELGSDSEPEGSTSVSGVDEDSATSSDIGDDASFSPANRAGRSASQSTFLPPKAKSLTPLPLERVKRRTTVPAPTVPPPSLIGLLRKNAGKDMSTIAMPVSTNEPLSLLQKAAEQLEYSELLDEAAKCTSPIEQMLWVAAFAISPLSGTRVKDRSIRKPFNPMLGETYELVREDKGFRFVSEKVSHRPVQLAFHAEAAEWSFTQSPKPQNKFWGKSSEISQEGKARLHFYATGNSYVWTAATCFLRNIIAGEKYIEPVGSMTVLNETKGQKAVITFKSKGMFSGRSEDVEVDIIDEHGARTALGLEGTWTSLLKRKDNKQTVWSAGHLVDNAPKHYGLTSYAAALNEITSVEKDKLPATDTRLRPDQRALEEGDYDTAEKTKNELEEAQRARRKEMEESGQEWKPRWFVKVDNGDEVVWKLKAGKEGYWEERAKGPWTGVVDVLKV
jgi:oxysterol-binding protein-related protein 3/6/7